MKILPWDYSLDKDPSKKLISSTVREWYDAKHRKNSKEKIEFINSIEILNCPHCGSVHFIKYGHYKNG